MQENLRGIIYKTFSKLLYYPDKELLTLITEGVIVEFLSGFDTENNKIEDLIQWLKEFNSKENLLETLQIEYTHLFITSFPAIAAPLFKSFYFEKEILGESTEKILDQYEKFRFHISEDMKEPADHLAILLEFIYRLTGLENSYEDQIYFIKNEILSWIEKLEQRINSSAEIPFYPLIINTVINYLKYDVTQYEIKLAGAKL